jgi:hypothetical protein
MAARSISAIASAQSSTRVACASTNAGALAITTTVNTRIERFTTLPYFL